MQKSHNLCEIRTLGFTAALAVDLLCDAEFLALALDLDLAFVEAFLLDLTALDCKPSIDEAMPALLLDTGAARAEMYANSSFCGKATTISTQW